MDMALELVGVPVTDVDRVVVGELHRVATAPRCRLDGDLVEDTTSRSIDHGRGVDADATTPMTTSTTSRRSPQTGRALSPSPDGTWFPVRDGGPAGP